ncbi:hypothetical protein A0J61_08455 [Choanephora cucurbitarum]|uniref:Uncharacterized protein n=1 Tax=Choanephora cucurbitarum TaxID=101091 RepID=A0A1C7N492_9FUNG|nr:hypothetical protein A0J61_08455 [Choanephora cucurbitarum]
MHFSSIRTLLNKATTVQQNLDPQLPSLYVFLSRVSHIAMNYMQNSDTVEQIETLTEQALTIKQVDAVLREFQQRQEQ